MMAAEFFGRRTEGAVFGVKVYGADWCEDTQHAREFLERLGVAYEYVDIEQDERAAQWVREQNGGKERKPTVDVAGQILCAPTDHELTSALRERGLMA
jgi:mycoredoxin